MIDPKKDFFALTLRELQAFAETDKAVILVTPGATLITRHSFLLTVGQAVCKVAIGQNDIKGRSRRKTARRVRAEHSNNRKPLASIRQGVG